MSVQSSVFGNKEIILVAETIAHEKGISIDSIISAIESGIVVAAKRQYGEYLNIECKIDKKTGKISLYNKIRVVADDFDDGEQSLSSYITLSDALKKDESLKVEDFISEELPPVPLKRVVAGLAKDEIFKHIKKTEKIKEYNKFKDREDEIAYCTVKKIGLKNILMDIDGFEGIIHKNHLIAKETLKVGDKVRAYIENVRQEEKGAQIFLSRSHPQFLVKLFAQEVPELYEGNIEVKAVARDPGSKAKIAVFSKRDDVDVIGSFIGIRGSRVQAVSSELKGEKIDIIKWSSDVPSMLINSLAPAKINKVIIDEDSKNVEVVVEEDQLSLAIGRGGQNVILASKLVGYKIDIITQEQEKERRSDEVTKVSNIFMEKLDVEDAIANLLASEGFNSVKEITEADLEEIANINGFDEEIAKEIKDRAISANANGDQ
jgi:N utilization substance protein A